MTRKLTTENHVKDLVREWYKARGAWHYAPIQNGLGEHGIHDRVGCIPIVVTQEMVGKTIGLAVTIEAKKPGRRGELRRGMSVHQQLQMEAVRAAGGLSICCDGEEDLTALNVALVTLQRYRD